MILSFWDWVRAKTRAAFIAGIQDGIAELDVVEVEVEDLAVLRLRLTVDAPEKDPTPQPPPAHEANGTHTTRKAAKGRA